MTAFSDFDAPEDHPLHPAAEQIHAYLRAYAEQFGVTERIRLHTAVNRVSPGWTVDGERFGAGPYRDRRTLVYGNGISGLEVASDLAPVTAVVSAFRKPRYVIQKVVDGVSSDWQWYTAFGALERRMLSREALSRTLRDRVVRVAGNPAAFGAPEPERDILTAGLSLCQDYLAQVADGRIICRPAIAAIDIPYLHDDVWALLGPDLALYQRTLHPDLPGFGAIGQFLAQGPYFPLLELQARWIVGTWSGDVPPPDEARMRRTIGEPTPALDPHNALAMTLADELGVAPDLLARPELTKAVLFGPLLPPRYRLDGPGALPDAGERFSRQLAASPQARVEIVSGSEQV